MVIANYQQNRLLIRLVVVYLHPMTTISSMIVSYYAVVIFDDLGWIVATTTSCGIIIAILICQPLMGCIGPEDCVPSISNSNNQMPLKAENSGDVRSTPGLMSRQSCKVNVYHNNHHQIKINKLIITFVVEKARCWINGWNKLNSISFSKCCFTCNE